MAWITCIQPFCARIECPGHSEKDKNYKWLPVFGDNFRQLWLLKLHTVHLLWSTLSMKGLTDSRIDTCEQE